MSKVFTHSRSNSYKEGESVPEAGLLAMSIQTLNAVKSMQEYSLTQEEDPPIEINANEVETNGGQSNGESEEEPKMQYVYRCDACNSAKLCGLPCFHIVVVKGELRDPDSSPFHSKCDIEESRWMFLYSSEYVGD